jgi:hypothetical protein
VTAGALAALLKASGFDVVERRSDVGIAGMRRGIGDFSDIAADDRQIKTDLPYWRLLLFSEYLEADHRLPGALVLLPSRKISWRAYGSGSASWNRRLAALNYLCAKYSNGSGNRCSPY